MHYPPAVRQNARRMRSAPASIEAKLWKLLRNRRLEGLKFRRQTPIGPYIADFVCFEHMLIVEADGPFHGPHDEMRDACLRRAGFRVIRFVNDRIGCDPDGVLADIRRAVETAREPPHPSR